MTDIATEITTAVQSTQLISVFVIFLFTLFYPIIQEKIRIKPNDSPKRNKNVRNEIKQTIKAQCFILLFINGLVLALFLPLSWTVFWNAFKNGNFDFSTNSFLLITFLILIIFLWILYLTYKLIENMRKFEDSAFWSFFGTVKLLSMGRVHFRDSKSKIINIDDKKYVIFRDIQIDEKNDEKNIKKKKPVVLKVTFPLKNMDPKNYILFSKLKIPCFIGLFNMRSAIFTINKENNCLNILYEWDFKDDAKKYSSPSVNEIIAWRSEPKSVISEIIPDTTLEQYLSKLD